jgi:hypothetical protein
MLTAEGIMLAFRPFEFLIRKWKDVPLFHRESMNKELRLLKKYSLQNDTQKYTNNVLYKSILGSHFLLRATH